MKRIASNTRRAHSKLDPTKKKLELHRETIRRLHETHLQLAAGGGEEPTLGTQASDGANQCC